MRAVHVKFTPQANRKTDSISAGVRICMRPTHSHLDSHLCHNKSNQTPSSGSRHDDRSPWSSGPGRRSHLRRSPRLRGINYRYPTILGNPRGTSENVIIHPSRHELSTGDKYDFPFQRSLTQPIFYPRLRHYPVLALQAKRNKNGTYYPAFNCVAAQNRLLSGVNKKLHVIGTPNIL